MGDGRSRIANIVEQCRACIAPESTRFRLARVLHGQERRASGQSAALSVRRIACLMGCGADLLVTTVTPFSP